MPEIEVPEPKSMVTCTSIDCPERKGGECNAHEKIRTEFQKQSWESVFDEFYNHTDGLGSSAWLVAPSTVKSFINGLIAQTYFTSTWTASPNIPTFKKPNRWQKFISKLLYGGRSRTRGKGDRERF